MAKALMREAAARRLAALSHPTRLRLLELLARGDRSVNELAQLSGEHPNTVSKHLRAMAAVRLLRRSQQGNHARYSIADPEIGRLVALAYRGVLRETERLQAVAELAAPTRHETWVRAD